MLTFSSSQLLDSGRGKERTQLCSRGRWKFDYAPMKIWAIQIVLDVFGE